MLRLSDEHDPTETQVARYDEQAERMRKALEGIEQFSFDRQMKMLSDVSTVNRDKEFYHTLSLSSVEAVTDARPIRLRMGIDTVHANVHALARLLERKGVITHDEFVEMLITTMGEYADDWDTRLESMKEGLL